MKTADLYVRVSTDEQADKGYSQRGQEEMLRKYCGINHIEVRKVIYEDHSAKTFNRPQWSQLLLDLKKSKGKVDLVLFTKWDRFSRNAGDAYQMISILRRLGVEPQAIEQPLDLSIPENKMMLAFYLAAPEVENDRRALNTFHGMRRARKEGRYMGVAPVGYINKITESGRKYIALQQPQASVLKWAFEELAQGIYSVEEVRRQAVRKGLRCSKTCFWRAIENPLYFGKIFIPGYKDEESRLAQGQHEALISENLFYEVQDSIDGKKKRQRPNVKEISNDMFPLRGFLKCPNCHRLLTASASKGRNGRYHYYHCVASCGPRYACGRLNDQFVKELQKFKPHKGVTELFKLVVNKAFKGQTKHSQTEKKHVLDQIDALNNKLGKARELLLTCDIDPKDYRTMKSEIEEKLVRLEANLTEMTTSVNSPVNLEKMLDRAVNALSNIDLVYTRSDTNQKREIIGSMYPEKLVFSESGYRTTKINEAAALIFQINSDLRKEKSGTFSDFSQKSRFVPGTGIEPVRALQLTGF
ncbi:recombinase family protein [Dyadobacter frigoris]|uniref:Recombinase family protein n=1 Tax=Dyadobacter frigoris TaxID=2576211 RepID=A0A4U6D990_9BACT|nr:recombinase family protein [Dyadobacter frigoris]TKT93346.1 recombinase family protein [Dyadobacter frigoris]